MRKCCDFEDPRVIFSNQRQLKVKVDPFSQGFKERCKLRKQHPSEKMDAVFLAFSWLRNQADHDIKWVYNFELATKSIE